MTKRLGLLALLVSLLMASSAMAGDWAQGVGARLELDWPAGVKAGPVYARLPDVQQLSLILPAAAGRKLVDSDGTEIQNVETITRDGTVQIWFRADTSRRYFLEWSPESMDQPHSPRQAPRGKPSDVAVGAGNHGGGAIASGGSDVDLDAIEADRKPTDPPASWAAGTVVDVIPRMRLRPTWVVQSGSVHETAVLANDYLMSRESFGDIDLSFNVRPQPGGYAGVIVRGDADVPDQNGLYWSIQVGGKEDQDESRNKTWGLVHDTSPGPALRAGEWNQLRVQAVGPVVTLSMDDKVCKTITLPGGKGLKGRIALATYRNMAEFGAVRVVEPGTGRVLLQDSFSGDQLDGAIWEDAAGKLAHGMIRVVNTGKQASKYSMRVAFHHDPWALNSLSLSPAAVPPGGASPWFWLGGSRLGLSAPMTVQVASPDQNPGRIEMGSGIGPGQIIRSLDLPAGGTIGVEAMRLGFDKANQLTTLDDDARQRLELIKAMRFPGAAPQRMPVGYAQGTRADLEAGRLLGFTAVFNHSSDFDAQAFSNLGYRYIYTYTHLISSPQFGYGYRREVNAREMKAEADAWRKLGVIDKVYRVSVYDEASMDVRDYWKEKDDHTDMSKDPDAWAQIMAAGGVAPADFLPKGQTWPAGADPLNKEAWSRLKIPSVADWKSDLDATMLKFKLYSGVWPTRFGNIASAIHEAYGTSVLTTANIHVNQYLRLNLALMDPWLLYGPRASLDSPSSCDYFVGYPLNDEFLVDMERSALCGADRPIEGYFAAQSHYLPTSASTLERRVVSSLGAGVRSLNFYEWGPRNLATENWYSDDPKRLESIGRVDFAAGWVEDILMDGKPVHGQVAILVSPRSDVWESVLPVPINHQLERRTLYALLRHLHYPVDFVHESYLPSDADLDRYKVLFVVDPCINAQTADRLIKWVRRGGTLVGDYSMGERDEMGRTGGALAKAFGLEGLDHEAGPTTQAASHPVWVNNGPFATIQGPLSQAYREHMLPLTPVGEGKGRFGFIGYPVGLAYFQGAVAKEGVLANTQAAVRDLIRPYVAPAGPPVCETSDPLVSVRVIQSPHGLAVMLINSTGEPTVKVHVTLRLPGVQSAQSLISGPLQLTKDSEGQTTWDSQVGLWDVIRMK